MTTPRKTLAASIREAVTTAGHAWPVRDYPAEPDPTGTTTVVVYQDEVAPSAAAGAAIYELTLKVLILSARDNAATREDALEDALGLVLEVLDADPTLLWTTAKRGVTEPFHNYEITVTAVGKKV